MRKNFYKILAAIFIFFAVFAVAKITFAASVNVGLNFGQSLGLPSTSPAIIASRIIQIFLGFLGIIAIGLIIYAGFLWMTAGGNEDQIDRAKRTLVSALIGLLIILSSFAIATFILNQLLSAVGGGGGGGGGGNGAGGIGGAGVLGACSVESVYPVPDQRNVPRNVSVMITFKEPVNPATICATVDANGKCNGSAILTNSVKIYKTNDGPDNYLTNVRVLNGDNLTFVFAPVEYLGSATENLYYTVNLTDNIKKAGTNDSIFSACGGTMNWQFQVSNVIDLTPPQVVSKGVFPPADNGADASSVTVPKQAVGSITVTGAPQVFAEATSTSISQGGGQTNAATAKVDPNDQEGGSLQIAVQADGISAQLSRGATLLGAARFSGRTINFPGILSLTAGDDVAAGNSWTINVTAVKQAETLTVGSTIYVFVRDSAAPNQISVGANTVATAANIVAAINSQDEVSAAAVNALINLKANRAGQAGNNLLVKSDSKALAVVSLSGGSDGGNSVTVSGQPDQPRNTVIEINFNESIMPAKVVGAASAVSDVIRVVNANPAAAVEGSHCLIDADCQSFSCVNNSCSGGNNYLPGTFSITNQYKTIEFRSDNQCGVNGCGEPIYCLPEKSQLRVEILAAAMAACPDSNFCSTKSPYNVCDSFCRKAIGGEIYPQADPALTGVTDAAGNSLDGNRDGKTAGPVSFYNENSPAAGSGDNYSWSFFISDVLDTTPPKIDSTAPVRNSQNPINADLQINFNKLMMASTLTTGSSKTANGQSVVVHKNINLINLSNKAVGYWIDSKQILNAQGVPDKTSATIDHGNLSEATSYRVQVGSGVRDIYQNCFKPSAGPGCTPGIDTPSCCNGVPTANLNATGNCP